jgi:hypothetical protein
VSCIGNFNAIQMDKFSFLQSTAAGTIWGKLLLVIDGPLSLTKGNLARILSEILACLRVTCGMAIAFRVTLKVCVGRDSSVGKANYTGCTVRGSITGGSEIFHTRPNWLWGLPFLLYNGHRLSFPGVKRPGCGAEHLFSQMPKSKKE